MATGRRRLEPLKTRHAIKADEELCDAIVLEIPTKLANKALSLVSSLISTSKSIPSQQHLRRLVTAKHLPGAFREAHSIPQEKGQTIFLLLLLLPEVSEELLISTLKPHVTNYEDLPRLFRTLVPLHPANTATQAKVWSTNYWPCSFNPAAQTIQNAPPLQLLRTVQRELDTDEADFYMILARQVAQESARDGRGRGIGAVVVDATKAKVIVASGDARHLDLLGERAQSDSLPNSDGRPENHAVMRAISMVAKKNLDDRGLGSETHVIFRDPSSDTENGSLSSAEIEYNQYAANVPGGYLCNGLDLYLTHEPCVCCAMAMVHSRFRACIFEKRMPGTGGLCAETDDGGLGYGLFWRKELNWRILTFQYNSSDDAAVSSSIERATFHA